MAFCKEYNAATQDKVGTVIPVEITVFEVSQGPTWCACDQIAEHLLPLLYAEPGLIHTILHSHFCFELAILMLLLLHDFMVGALTADYAWTLQDRSFTFILKTPPASVLLAKAAGVPKGSGNPKAQKVGKISQAQLKVCVYTVALAWAFVQSGYKFTEPIFICWPPVAPQDIEYILVDRSID